MYQTKAKPASGQIIGTPDPDRMASILSAMDYIERVRRIRRDNARWWDTLVQRALACGLGLFVLALLAALWVTR